MFYYGQAEIFHFEHSAEDVESHCYGAIYQTEGHYRIYNLTVFSE